jgi:molybdate transport system ATP-binding protein
MTALDPEHSTSGIQLQTRLQRGGFALDLNLQLPDRGVTVLSGPSGSGKTTALRVLAGLEPLAQGRVVVSGQVWQDTATGTWVPVHRRALGLVFQEASLFEHLTVEGNLKYGHRRTPPTERVQRWDQALSLLGIEHLLQRRPQELSGGERQRVAIARALAASPRVLLMDEPLAALDAARKAEILPWLEQLHEQLDIPVVYVTHSTDELARLADHLVLLDNGHVRASGPVMALLTRLDLPLSHGDGAAALIEARICGQSPGDGLCALSFSGGRLLLPQTRSVPLSEGQRVRVRIQARDVSLSLVEPLQTSVLNILPATVTDLSDDGPGQVLVGLSVTSHHGSSETLHTRLLSRISQVSAQRLGIAPGLPVYAQIKGVAMVR